MPKSQKSHILGIMGVWGCGDLATLSRLCLDTSDKNFPFLEKISN